MSTGIQMDLSKEQWGFLSVFEAIEGAVSLDVAGSIVPLLPSSLIILLRLAAEYQLLIQEDDNTYRLATKLPDPIRQKLQAINTKSRLSRLVDRIDELKIKDLLSPGAYINLLIRAGKKDAGKYKVRLAHKMLEMNQAEKALSYYLQALGGMSRLKKLEQLDSGFVSYTLEFSELCIALGKNFEDAREMLEIAKKVAARLKDKRSEIMICMHLGRILYFGNKHKQAFELFTIGKNGVEELGDDDIRERTSEFIALYYYLQGRLAEAMEYLEKGYRAFESGKGFKATNITAPIYYGYCAAHLGQFHKAIGCLDSTWRRAKQEAKYAYASTIRAVLGSILLMIKKNQEAEIHLQGAWEEAVACDNALGKHCCRGGMAYLRYLEGDLEEAHRLLTEVAEDSNSAFIKDYFSVPWILEIAIDLMIMEYPKIPGMDYNSFDDVLEYQSVHLRGVSWRLMAKLLSVLPESGKELNQVLKRDSLFDEIPACPVKSQAAQTEFLILKLSEICLKISGDPIQLAKTRIEIARLMLADKQIEEARILARKARKGLSGTWESSFPDGLRYLLEESDQETNDQPQTILVDRFLQMANEFTLSLQMDNLFDLLLTAMNRFFGAERGAVFWVENMKSKTLGLRSSYNLHKGEVNSESFRPHFKQVIDAFKNGKPILLRSESMVRKLPRFNVFALICLPLKQDGEVKGVLYHDNSYLEGCFRFINNEVLQQLTQHLNTFVERITHVERLVNDVKELARYESKQRTEQEGKQIIFQSQLVAEVINKADRVAKSDTAVLIQGKTGVGKELLASRLHMMSLRREKPFVIIDPTTIPENLLESELFGHEKGSFTGAIKQKLGRVELANGGTLFIDEIGEISKPIQSKLLRVLQEKTFTRIGGNQTIVSDFRLVAATNRNLVNEVALGNFREDLFYRINVVPITIPSLHERNEDILLLANYFLDRYTKKYQCRTLEISTDQQKALLNYSWPGNVRELKSVIERAVILSQNGELELNLGTGNASFEIHPFSDLPDFDEIQQRYFRYILTKCHNKIGGTGGAAEITGINRSTLYSRLKKLEIL